MIYHGDKTGRIGGLFLFLLSILRFALLLINQRCSDCLAQ